MVNHHRSPPFGNIWDKIFGTLSKHVHSKSKISKIFFPGDPMVVCVFFVSLESELTFFRASTCERSTSPRVSLRFRKRRGKNTYIHYIDPENDGLKMTSPWGYHLFRCKKAFSFCKTTSISRYLEFL